jgi:acetoin utilization deacetylase AcuC-like enzyme
MPMQAFYADQFVLPLPPGHSFPMSKYRLLRERLDGLPGIEMCQAIPATDGELALAHTPGYLAAVTDGTLSAGQQREIGFPWSEAMVARARRSVGATIFNDVAVAARLMQAERHRTHRQLLRVAVIDLDVHQGNGTAAIFQDDPTVFTLSLHGAKNFPFRKEHSDLDVDLPDGCTDADYLRALDDALTELWRRHADAPPGRR